MGLLDDAASVVSTRSKKSRSHRSHRSHKSHSRSRSRSRSPGRRSHGAASVIGGSGLGGIAASIFGGGSDDEDRHHRHKKSHHSATRSFFGGDDYKKHSASRSSFFGLGGGSTSGHGHGGRSPSYYKRSPRPNFVSRVVRRLKRLLRDLVYYAKRHPLKVFMLVIMPLITGGFLTALLAKFGLRLPPSIMKMLGIAGKAATGDSIGLVGEAVRMASGAGLGGGLGKAAVSVERGRDGAMSWERRSVERDVLGGNGGGGGGWGDVGGLLGIAKMFS